MAENRSLKWCKRNRDDVALVLGVSPGRVSQMVKDGVLSPPVSGLYDLVECNKAFQKYKEGDSRGQFMDERARLTQHQADYKELEVEEKRGELVPVREAERLWSYVVISTRQKLLALSSRIAPSINENQSLPERKSIIDKVVYEVLNELSSPRLSEVKNLERNTKGVGNLQAAAGSHNKRMGRCRKKIKPRVKRGAGKVAHRPGGVPEGNDGRDKRPGDRVRVGDDISAGGENGNPE